MGKHALLSASSSHRWLNCPPSARLCEKYEDTGSEYAQEGTDAHSLCEYKLKQALGMDAADPTEDLSFYNEEMEQCATDYAAYVLELVEDAKKSCKDPVVLIEQRLDFSRFVKDGFGTGDCVIIADGDSRYCGLQAWERRGGIRSRESPDDAVCPGRSGTVLTVSMILIPSA